MCASLYETISPAPTTVVISLRAGRNALAMFAVGRMYRWPPTRISIPSVIASVSGR